MILNEIVADDLGPGANNPQRIAALRNRLASLHPDGVPFLLLPVRIETRFMRVDRPLTTPPADPFASVNGLRAQLDAIAGRNFATQLLPGQRDAMKLAELAHARFLDAALAAIQAARLPVLTSLRNSGQLTADAVAKLRAAADGLGTSYAAALASIARLRSEHQRTTYTQMLAALQQRVLAPIQDEIRAVTAPKLELMTALRTVPTKDVITRINELRTHLAALRPGAALSELSPAHEALDGQLRGLRELSHGLLHGTRAELDELRAAWNPIAGGIHRFAVSMAAAPAGGSGEATARAAAAERLAALLPDLAALGKRSTRDFETLTNLRLERGARAITEVDVQMDWLAQLLASKPAPASRRSAQALAVVAEAMAIAKRVDALLREVPILPLERYRAGVERFERAAAALAPWRAQVAALALRRLPEAQVLIRDGDAALAALKRSVLSQRTDAWDGDAAPLDGVRRKLFALDTTATHTVDELWVRIFPDDIAVHTHEPGLTDDEKSDGKAFWVETVAASGDTTLQRGAWRALAQRYGSPRAAWIARSLQPAPTLAAATHSAGAHFIGAVETLQRRIVERASRPAGVERAGTSRVRKMIAAAEAAIEAGRGIHELTPAQRQRLAPMLSTVRDQLDGLGARLMRRARFAAERDSRLGELEALRQKFAEIEALAEPMRTVDPHDAEKRQAALAFAEAPDKAGPWSTAPHCPALPERFVVLAVRSDRVVHAVAGETVGDLRVGLDPDPNAPGEIFALDEDGNLLAGDSIRWMVDFDEARAKGLALCVPISIDEAASGFDELLVLGVREASAADALVLVQNLIENHHYTGGMAFLPIGSATNNTEAMVAARRSDADPDQTFDVERAAPLFDSAPASPLDAADGLRFARALGLDPSLVAHIDEAGGRDASDAATMNGALWPATIGAYIEEFLGSLVSPDTAHRLRSFFRDNVSARGWLPAMRVGQQPYGVLTTTAFSRFVPDGGDLLPPLPAAGPAALGEADRQRRFDILLRDLLAAAAADWSRIRAAKVKHVHSPGVTDPQRHFMDILGLSPASVAAEYRFALNVGSRHPTSVSSNPQLPFGFSPLGPAGFFEHFDAWLRRAYGLAAGPFIDKGLVTAPLRAFFELLSDERAYSVRFLDKARSVRGAVSGAGGATYVNGLLTSSVASLVDDARRRRGASNALLFLLLRQALMAQVLDSTLSILQLEGMLTAEARRRAGSSDEFLVRTLKSDVYATKWSYVFGALAELDGRFDVHFPTTGLYPYLQSGTPRTMADYLARRGDNASFNGFPGKALHLAERAELQQHADRVARVGQIAAPGLDALVREHLDLCSHRLDAWQLGLAVRRLGSLRAQTSTGVYLGAYGWLEDLRPKAKTPIAEGLPPALHRDGEAQVFADPENEGFIHAPSLTHAVTAAILRSAYLSETSQPDIEDAMAVNLSSRRVRQALELLDGVQAGNDLGALLGYRLEHELHEAYATQNVSFDALIFALRRQYPGVAAVDPSTSVPETSRRLVVDGLTLLNTVRHWVEDKVPLAARRDRTLFEILSASANATLPLPAEALDAQHRQGVFQAIDSLADALDAVGDLSLSEAIFQIVRGNFPRAAAVVAALAEGRPVPRPQIAKTPRGGTTVVHRVLLPLPRFDGHALSSLEVADAAALAAARAAALPAGWSTPMTMSARANAEPGLNHWLGELLGDPAHIVCRFEDPAAGAAVREVTAAKLGLQPLDLLAMLGSGLEDGAAELSARIAYWALPVNLDLGTTLEAGPRPAIVLRLEERGPAWTRADRSFAEIEPLLVEMQTMLGRARAATREDLVFDESATAAPASRAPSWDAGELGARVAEARARLHQLGSDIMAVLAGGPPGDAIDTIDPAAWARTHTAVFDDPAVLGRARELGLLALRAADFGVTVALPPMRFETPAAVIAGLRASVVNAFVQVVERLRAAGAAVDGGDLIEATRAIFGKAFVAAPAFALTDATTIRAQLAATELLPGDNIAMEGWLASVATVREPVAALQRAWTLGEAFGAAGPSPRPAQLPAQPGDRWLGLPFPADYEPSSDKLSLVLLRGDAWAKPDAEVAAILVDQWTETIPHRSETTGIAFHYDSPDSMPPQSMLLVVPPALRGMWRWDDLVHTLHDTLDLARSRAVEPEHFAGEVYAQLLPAVIGELVPDHLGSSDGEVGGSRVILDFGINNAP